MAKYNCPRCNRENDYNPFSECIYKCKRCMFGVKVYSYNKNNYRAYIKAFKRELEEIEINNLIKGVLDN